MASHGYTYLIKSFIHQLPKEAVPSIIEVGVDRGVMWLPLVVFLARTRPKFLAIGVDILVQEQVSLMLQHFDLSPEQQAYLIESNSLEVLPKMVDQGMQFDVVLLDGDHNYHTVKHEMEHLNDLTTTSGIVVIDDCEGRWANRDLFYSERPGYENVSIATPRIDTDKHGVRPAVHEWLAANQNWQMSQPIPGEAVLLMRKVS